MDERLPENSFDPPRIDPEKLARLAAAGTILVTVSACKPKPKTVSPLVKKVPTKEAPTPTPTPPPVEIPSPVPQEEMLPLNHQELYGEFTQSYEDWQRRYLSTTNLPPEQVRVIRPENNQDTVSEGIAYGMMMAVNIEDKATFDQLWHYAQAHFNAHELMSWRVTAQGEIPDPNSATDADLDMAYGLVIADKTWGGYREEALGLLEKIARDDIEANTFVLKPGDAWGGSNALNPSYFSPGYFELFRQYTGEEIWSLVAAKSREILDKIEQKHGLFPNWATAEGNPVTEPDMGKGSYTFGYDAVRVPWRQAMALLWYADQPEIAQSARLQLEKVNSCLGQANPGEIVDGYGKQGQVVGEYHNAAFVAAVSASSIVSPEPERKAALVEELIRLDHQGYYHDSLRALSLLLLSGEMEH
ncbi:MAG TPA: glycosyl hydrolase family 8 [Clostridia bacterium]|nr:glycosyl hydrolase family 8 [Clostridia bacterium]